MVDIVRIPKLGLSDFGDLVSWEVDVGDRVSEGQVVAVIESDKASAEIESPADGILLKTYVDEGAEIAIDVGKPLAVIGSDGESAPSLDALEDGEGVDSSDASSDERSTADDGASTSSVDVKATPRAKRMAREEDIDLTPIDGTGPQDAITTDDIEQFLANQESDDAAASSDTADVKLTPRAKRRAQGVDVDLTAIDGTGPQGAVTEDDVERYLESTEETDDAGEGDGALTVRDAQELTGTRRVIADRLSQSAREKPHVMGSREIPIERLESVRDRLERKYDVEVSLNDLLIHMVGKVLRDLPEFNAHFEDGTHKLIDEVNVGYAVDGPTGLVVPVLEGVDELSLSELADQRRTTVDRVLNNEYTSDDLQGGTFTITNVGVFDIDVSYSIINPPEVAILAIGRRKYAPVERDGDVELEKVITFSLTIDHRVLDGADSGAFLEQLAEYIEYPGTVLEGL